MFIWVVLIESPWTLVGLLIERDNDKKFNECWGEGRTACSSPQFPIQALNPIRERLASFPKSARIVRRDLPAITAITKARPRPKPAVSVHLARTRTTRLQTATMAATEAEAADALYNLRLSIKASASPILTTSAEPTPADTVADLALATHVSFNTDSGDHRTFALSTPTRFAPDGKAVDLRSCYFAWLNKDASVTDYFAAVQTLNEELPSGAGGSVQNLTFAQKIELIAWLSGETESSDSIAAIDGGALSAAAGDAAAIAGGKGVPVDGGRGIKVGAAGNMVDARLLQIYDGERKMGDHNSVLRGTKNVVRIPNPLI